MNKLRSPCLHPPGLLPSLRPHPPWPSFLSCGRSNLEEMVQEGRSVQSNSNIGNAGHQGLQVKDCGKASEPSPSFIPEKRRRGRPRKIKQTSGEQSVERLGCRTDETSPEVESTGNTRVSSSRSRRSRSKNSNNSDEAMRSNKLESVRGWTVGDDIHGETTEQVLYLKGRPRESASIEDGDGNDQTTSYGDSISAVNIDACLHSAGHSSNGFTGPNLAGQNIEVVESVDDKHFRKRPETDLKAVKESVQDLDCVSSAKIRKHGSFDEEAFQKDVNNREGDVRIESLTGAQEVNVLDEGTGEDSPNVRRLGTSTESQLGDASSASEEDIDYPLWMEEEDPNWPVEGDDGWGFKVSKFFTDPKIKSVKESDEEDGEDQWEFEDEPDQCVQEITSMEWQAMVFNDPSPLVVLIFERYGKRASDSWNLLKELEEAVNQIWDSNKLPPRTIKINASTEIDLASALNVKVVPMLLFTKAGKLLHNLTGHWRAEELIKIIAYFYYGAGRPSFLNEDTKTSQNLISR